MKSAFLILVSVILSFVTMTLFTNKNVSDEVLGVTSVKQESESLYDKVIRTGVIDCGYFVEAPFTIKNEATGEISGIAVDLINVIAKDLNLKINWKEQISFATFPDDLNNKKYDMICGSVFVLPRAGKIDYADTYAQVPVYGYVTPNNTSFDRSFSDIDWKNVTISGLDGEGATTAAQKVLPEAKMQILPQLSNISEMLLVVSSGKADIAFVMPTVFEEFNKTNAGKLRKANLDKALYNVTFAIPRNELEFKSMLNNSMRQLKVSGELESLLNKYDPQKHFGR